MKFFIASSLCWDYLPTEVITIAKENKLHGVEMWAEHIYTMEETPTEIRKYAERMGIELTLHASSWDLNFCSLNKAIQLQSVSELKKSINLAADLGALHMTLHPGRFTVKDYITDFHWEAMIHNLQELVRHALNKNVVLSLELMEPIPKEIVTIPEVMNQLLHEVGEGLNVTLDIAHTPLKEKNIDYFNQLNQVNSIHLSDSSSTTFHLPLGEGDIDLGEVLEGFSSVELPIVIEGMDTTRKLDFMEKHLEYLRENGWLERKTSF